MLKQYTAVYHTHAHGGAGGGVTQIVMPYLTQGISHHVPEFQAWRYAFFFPGCMQILWALMILSFGQVCPLL